MLTQFNHPNTIFYCWYTDNVHSLFSQWCDNVHMNHKWRFPKMGVPPVLIHLKPFIHRISSYKPSSYWGTIILGNLHETCRDITRRGHWQVKKIMGCASQGHCHWVFNTRHKPLFRNKKWVQKTWDLSWLGLISDGFHIHLRVV